MSTPAAFTTRLGEIQSYLERAELAGWLIYDFHGLNAVARELVPPEHYHVTRRWFYLIPRTGEPVLLAHKIEERNFPPLPGRRLYYAGWQELHKLLRTLLPRDGALAMEYSPMSDVPTVSFVDAGMMELLRSLGAQVVSSAQLVQEFQARWSAEQLQTHVEAAAILHRIQQEAFAMIAAALPARKPVNEYEVQQFILARMAEAECITDSDPIVAVNANASNPHYAPGANEYTAIQRGDVILIDLWAKKKTPGAVFADITWMGYAGTAVPKRVQEVFAVVRQARDLGVQVIRDHVAAGEHLPGWRVDEAVRKFITEAGFGQYFVHRTGHSLGMATHDKGVNIDSYETRDTRELTPGVAFSIEPGIYLPEFGIRSEINVYMGVHGPEVHTPPQQEITRLDV